MKSKPAWRLPFFVTMALVLLRAKGFSKFGLVPKLTNSIDSRRLSFHATGFLCGLVPKPLFYSSNVNGRLSFFAPLQSRSVANDASVAGSLDFECNDWEETVENDQENEDERDDDRFNEDDEGRSPLLDEFTRWSQSVSKVRESLQKKKNSLSKELEKASAVEETMHRAQLLTSYTYLFASGVKSAVVEDWENDGVQVELTLDSSYDSASAEADALFQQARKLKRGSIVVSDLLQETSEALGITEEIETDMSACVTNDNVVDTNMLRLVQDRLIRTARQTGFKEPLEKDENKSKNDNNQSSSKRKPTLGTPASNIRKLMSPGGCIVMVGRNRRGNEYLTFNVARGDDIWMHSRGCPGAHVLLQQRRGSPPATDACIQFAADLAIFYSDARSERSFDVTAAEPKHLLKSPGSPLGAVKLREENKVYTGYPDQVADELKKAREESGQEEAYRFNDKAKHRKRTKEAAKQAQAKSRSQKRKRKGKHSNNNDDE